MKRTKIICAAAVSALLCASLAGCGCGKKEKDPASEQVLEISITPEPSPTLAPEEVDPSAVVTNGDITMVNSYLTESGAGGSGKDTGASAEEEAVSGKEETGDSAEPADSGDDSDTDEQ